MNKKMNEKRKEKRKRLERTRSCYKKEYRTLEKKSSTSITIAG